MQQVTCMAIIVIPVVIVTMATISEQFNNGLSVIIHI